MKLILVVSLLTLSLGAGASIKKPKTAAKKPKASATAPAAAAPSSSASKKKLSKDISFNGANVDGKYLSAGESIAEIEGDKDMGALIGIRKNFRDRSNLEIARLQAQTSQSAVSGKGQ